MFAHPKKETFVSICSIESKVDDFQLLSYYFGINKAGLYKSPFRSDSNPSFGIYQQNGRVKFKDFSTNEFGGIYDMLSIKWGFTLVEVLNKISKDFKIDVNAKVPQVRMTEIYCFQKKSAETKIDIRVRKWTNDDLSYWSSYGIDISFLKKFNIYPIDYYWINGHMFRANKIAYSYVEYEGVEPRFKIYQPLTKDKRYKWFNNYKKGTISLLNEIPTDPETVVVCSSVKDALCFWNNFGIPCISPQGEGMDIDFDFLKKKFPNTMFFVCFDNDEAGKMFSENLCEKHGVPNIIIPDFEGGKDISDMFKVLGKKEFVKRLSLTISFIKNSRRIFNVNNSINTVHCS